MSKIRLVKESYHSYTGPIGTVQFENGVSVSDVTFREIQLIGALTRIEVIENGVAQAAGPAQDLLDKRGEEAPVLTPRPTGEHQPAPEVPTSVLVEAPEQPKDEIEDLKDELDESVGDFEAAMKSLEGNEPGFKTYTRDELESIADEEGIKGLRKIGDPLGVKDTRIEGLMSEILNAQNVKLAKAEL